MKFSAVLLTLGLLFASMTFAADKAPEFKAQSIDGEQFTLSTALENGPVLIDFWATWCKPCKKALPKIDHIDKTYCDKGLQVITISVDSPRGQKKIKPFIKGRGYEFDVLLDPNSEVRKLFGGEDIPLTLIIDHTGEIVYKQLGYRPGAEEEMEKIVKASIEKFNASAEKTESSTEEEVVE